MSARSPDDVLTRGCVLYIVLVLVSAALGGFFGWPTGVLAAAVLLLLLWVAT